MNNHPLTNPKTGEIEWISRAIAVVVGVLARDKDGHLHILVEQRGPKTPDPEYRGCWCMPCGYLDYNETIKEAAVREVFEETGVELLPVYLNLWSINDNPTSDKRQNVTFRYITYIGGKTIEDIDLHFKYAEDGEVSDITWVDLRFISDIKWAFNHAELIQEIKKIYS